MNAKPRTRAGLYHRSRVSPNENVQRNQPFVSIQNRSASGLRGVDLVEQVAQSTAIQRRRWTELYHYLWERKTKLDITDTILFMNGSPADWYFTSAVTGVRNFSVREVTRKSSSKLNAIAIRRECTKVTSSNDQSRQKLRARLVHEESGQLVYTPLRDGEISFVLSQPPSDLAVASVLLQPLLPSSRQPANARGTFVAKYNVTATSLCTRVLHQENDGLYGLLPSQATTAYFEAIAVARARRPRSAPVTTQSYQLEDIVKGELRKLVHEVEAAFRDRVRLLTADFQVTDMHRLVLVRVSGVVFFSDLVQKKEIPPTTLHNVKERRGAHRGTSSIAVDDSNNCTGRAFCHCIDIVSAPGFSRFRSSRKQTELCQIARKSVSRSENESAFLERFGAEAEATLRHIESSDLISTSSWARRGKAGSDQLPAVMKLLERRIFMLQNTLWNPKSDAFDPKALEFEDTQWLPREYEMVSVCRACYLIYQAIDDERFNRSRETATAAARRSTELLRSKFLESERAAIATKHRNPNSAIGQTRETWEVEEEESI